MVHLSAGSQTLPCPLSNSPVVKRVLFQMSSLETLLKHHSLKEVLLLLQLLLCLYNSKCQCHECLLISFKSMNFLNIALLLIYKIKLFIETKGQLKNHCLFQAFCIWVMGFLFTVGIIKMIFHWRLQHVFHLLLYPKKCYSRFCGFLRQKKSTIFSSPNVLRVQPCSKRNKTNADQPGIWERKFCELGCHVSDSLLEWVPKPINTEAKQICIFVICFKA